ncbi:MAG: kynureninase [Bradyrhizobiaceae bacterium]|nr:kynureninase [Bradyrhizobiaceae bacterium]
MTHFVQEAEELDATDVLAPFRDRFHLPLHNGSPAIYFTGNSLGLMPKATERMVMEELEDWQHLGVEGHMHSRRPWFSYHRQLRSHLAHIAGALETEVVAMNSLTANLHAMMVSFYRPTQTRFKILMVGQEFPSDRYAVCSMTQWHGFDPAQAVIELTPDHGTHTLSAARIAQAIEQHADTLALVMFSGVHFYTGQYFDIPTITKQAHAVGASVGFDLAHAFGNVNLQLHEWGPDFAVWCSYKYLNSGPGGVGGVFVHDRHANRPDLPRLAGWWGNEESTRFQMKPDFEPSYGADGWQLSNAPVLSMAAQLASLQIFSEARMERIGEKRDALTGFAERVVNTAIGDRTDVRIITPSNPKDRGAQLSIQFDHGGRDVFDALIAAGVVVDWRTPNVIRMAPVPLYNTFCDVARFGIILKDILG